MPEGLGNVVIAIFDRCPFDTINGAEDLRKILVGACESAGAVIINSLDYQFHKTESPETRDCASAVALMVESHGAVHSWSKRNLLVLVVCIRGSVDPLKVTCLVGKFVEASRFKIVLTDLEELFNDGRFPWVSCGS